LTEANPFEPPRAALEKPDEEVDSRAAAPPLWNPNVAGLWSLFLTPIFGSLLVRKNWEAIGDAREARVGTVWLGVSILIEAAWFTDAVGPAIPFLFMVVWYVAFQRIQALYVRERWGTDYPHKPWALTVGMGFVVLFAIGFAVGILHWLVFEAET